MKKIVVIGGAGIVVVAVIIFSFLVSGKSATAPGALLPTPTVGSFNNRAPSGAKNQIIRQTTDHYSIGVPSTFTASESPNTSGGKTLVMIPSESSFKGENASISVQETDASVSTLQRQKDVFSTLGHTSTSISLGGIPAVKYSSKIPLPGGKSLFETVILFQKGSIVYQVRLGYEGTRSDQALENTFDAVIANLSVN